jgi:hypothetical protein
MAIADHAERRADGATAGPDTDPDAAAPALPPMDLAVAMQRPLGRSRPRPPWRGADALAAGRAVLVGDLADDRRLHPLARAAGLAELVVSRRALDARVALAALPTDLVDRAVALLDQVDDADLWTLDLRLADRLAAACARAGKELAAEGRPILDLSQRLHAVRRDVTGADPRRRGPGDDGVDGLETDLDLVHLDLVHLDLADPDLTDVEPTELEDGAVVTTGTSPLLVAGHPGAPIVERVEPALVHVEVPRVAGVDGRDPTARGGAPLWVRVLHRRGMAPLGMAPLGVPTSPARAEVVVPPDVADEDLVVQVVGDDDLAALVDGPLHAVRSAIAAGREAALWSRGRRPRQASRRWRRCAELWIVAGDPRRAELARDLADTGGRYLHGPRSLVDDVAVALHVEPAGIA